MPFNSKPISSCVRSACFLWLALFAFSCGKNNGVSENVADSVSEVRDSTQAVVESRDPNVYEIPSNHPWLVKLIGERFPWDSAGYCYRVQTFNASLAPDAEVTQETSDNVRHTIYTYQQESYVEVVEDANPNAQDCIDNLCGVVLTSDWLPIRMGLRIGTTRAEFLQTINLDKNLKQNIFKYWYAVDGSLSVEVRFEFTDDLMTLFSYQLTPCSVRSLLVPKDPFFTALFNKPFVANKPDSVLAMIPAPVTIMAQDERGEYSRIDKISESEMYPQFRFDSSTLSFKKWPQWEIVYSELKSPNFQFINGVKVGMSRKEFLRRMGEDEFKGDEFTKWNRYCSDGFIRANSLSVNFRDDVITGISYSREKCN